MELTLFFLRWIHFLAGITWIGILYYFNFVQTPFFAETEAPVRVGAIQKLVPRALWWFRWGAMITFLAGILMYIMKWGQQGSEIFFTQQYGVAITLGGLIGTIGLAVAGNFRRRLRLVLIRFGIGRLIVDCCRLISGRLRAIGAGASLPARVARRLGKRADRDRQCNQQDKSLSY